MSVEGTLDLRDCGVQRKAIFTILTQPAIHKLNALPSLHSLQPILSQEPVHHIVACLVGHQSDTPSQIILLNIQAPYVGSIVPKASRKSCWFIGPTRLFYHVGILPRVSGG